jgi:DedD protein
MDSKGKQRLTGAVILVALFVLLVPELLTGPKDGAGTAPSEEGMRRYTIDIDAPTSSVQPVSPPEAAPAMSLPPVAESPQPDAPSGDAARAAPGDAAPAEVAATLPRAPNPEPAKVDTPVELPRSEPPRAEPPKVESPRTAASSSGSFAVQLGSFVSKENADRLVREMTAKGFNAFVAPPIKSGGRDLYRVRVGPTRDRAASEALAIQLRRIGQNGSVVPIS